MKQTTQETKPKKQKKQKRQGEGSRLYRVIYAIFAGLVGWYLRVRVVGGENEPDTGRFVVCGNHTAKADAVVICYAFRKHQVRCMAKQELFKIPVLAQLLRLLGAFPVDRSGNDVGAIKKAVAMVKEGGCMGIFPQGTRYQAVDPRTTPTKNGAALITVRAEADVIPVYIHRKNHTPKMFRKTWIVIGKPIPYAELAYDPEANGEYGRITDVIFDRICTLGEEFRRDMEAGKYKK